ncbi:cell division protein FtsZ [bacterium]|nr:cell division protein FtsZ [bacterium]
MAIRLDSLESRSNCYGLPNIKVIGIGGGGGNVVNRMIKDNVRGVEYIAMNTDAMALNSNKASIIVPLGNDITRGLGAGMKPDIGRVAAEAEIDVIENVLENADMVFLAAGMGGGTGTGAIPIVAEVAKNMNILTVAVVTTPFSFEGRRRAQIAEGGLAELRRHIDTLVVIPNTKLLHLATEKTTMTEAFSMADDVLKQAIAGITNLINLEGVINLDFADLRTVMEDKGSALMGTGSGFGENRGLEAVKKAINSPLISQPIGGATGIIINIVADNDFPLLDAEAAATYVQEKAHENADVIFGLVHDGTLKNEVFVTVIATGYEKSLKEKSTGNYRRSPLRVTDSLKYQVKKQQPEVKFQLPNPKPVKAAEEIEVPHFMKHRNQQ